MSHFICQQKKSTSSLLFPTKRSVAKCSCNFRTEFKGQMFFFLLVALWTTYGVAGTFQGPLVPLRFIQEPADTVARKNEAVTLNCGVEGSPSPTKITWEKDGVSIKADSRRRIGPNGALLISKIIHNRQHKPDVGEYQCFALSPAGRIASHKVHLDIAGISKKFLYEPQSTTVRVGLIARFSCLIHRAVPPATITWEKDGSLLSSSDRLVILDQGVLQIKNVKKADEGNYRCIASNFAKTRYSQAASLTVQTGSAMDKMRLKFIGIPHNTTVFKGDTTVLECAATGYPIPTIRWKRLGGSLRDPSVPTATYGINNLHFTNINESDEGEYKCQASSNGQTISRSVWLFVRVHPRFTKRPANLKWTTAQPVLLKCAVTGSPIPTLSWLKNGNELISSGKTRIAYYKGGADLTISSITSSDSGMYQCFAQNEVGSIQASASVIVHKSDDQPGPPTNVVAIALSHSPSSILISWSPPIGHYRITAYTVHYQKLGGGNSNEKQDVLGNDTHSHEVEGLQGYTNYTFYVRAYTKVIGRESESIVQRTRQGSPTRPPINVKVTSNTPDSLDVTWQAPPRDYQNGIITKYVITYKESGQRRLPNTLEVPGHILHRTVNGLSKGTTYSIKVSAATVIGQGPLSRPVNGTVLLQSTNMIISAPTLWIAGKNSSVLLVKWLPPMYGQHSVHGYHLFYVQLQGSKTEKGPFIVGKQHQSYSLNGLSPGTGFLIKVMAWNGKTLGQPGAVYATTDRDPHATPTPVVDRHRPPPSRPIHLLCNVESRTSLLLTWQSQLSAERIAYYTVKYHPRNSFSPQPVERQVFSENIIITGLIPKRDYTISVQSHYETETKDYPDSISTTQKYCSIPPSGPSSPQNLKFEYRTVTSVEIKWEAPVMPNGELTSYDIFYTYNNSFPDSKWMVETKPLRFPSSYAKEFTARLIGIKENTAFYLKIRAENKDGYGPFCDTAIIQPPTTASRVPPNISYVIISPRLVQLSWPSPQVFDAFVTSFTILFTNRVDLPEDKWNMQTVVLGSSDRFPSLVTTTMAVDPYKTYHVKVRAEYDDYVPGKWSEIVKISMQGKNNSGSVESTKDPRISEIEDNPKLNIKLGIIIGCTISAFCLVVLILFIVWRNPCRQVPVDQGTEKGSVNGCPSLPPSHLQQIAVSGKQDNSGSTEETSASSGMCQCKCTCGAGSRWPLGPSMVRTNNKLPGSSDSSTPITQVFSSSTPGGDSEGSLSHEDLRNKKECYNPGSSSSSVSVELHREEQMKAIPVSSRSYKQSRSVDV